MNDGETINKTRVPQNNMPEKMTINPVTLSFNGACSFLEPLFISDENTKIQKLNRIALFIGLVICVFMGLLEIALLPINLLSTFWLIRSGLIGSIAVLYFLSKQKIFIKYTQVFITQCAFSCGLLLIVMMMMGTSIVQSTYFFGFILTFLIIFLVIRTRFTYATVSGLLMYFCFVISCIFFIKLPYDITFANSLFLFLVLLVCIFATYSLEYDSRRRFFLSYQLDVEKEKTNQMVSALESRVQTRTQELSSSNTRLMIEIAERKQAQNEYVYLATHDTLTNLPNRSLMRDRLRHALSRARRNEIPLAVFFIDLDGFKAVNDAYSHNSGDLLLKQVSERLISCLRENDTISRFGGDEFVILIEGLHKKIDASEVAKKILTSIEQPFILDVAEVFITASIGITIFPDHGDTADMLLKNADLAMYQAKNFSKNSYQFFTEHISEKASSRAVLGTQLRKALSVNEFFLLYQPQVHLGTGKIVGVEALIRWKHPNQGLLAPSRFIPVAEETGLIVPIGEWALKTACNQINSWRLAHLPPIRVAVNISGRQLKEADFVERVERILAETHVPPDLLELELTESVVFQYTGDNHTLLKRLKKHGIQLAVDDFGQGYSTLSHLARLPFDKLKMDKSFADNIAADTNDSVVAAGIINIANRLGMIVVAEGVETNEQLIQYEMQGCNHVQGWIFSRAVDADRIGEMLASGVFDNYHVMLGGDHGMERLV